MNSLKKLSFGMIVFTFCLCLVAIWQVMTSQEPATKICQNLLESRLIENDDKCVITNVTPNYMEAMFPVGKVDIAYVKSGMAGFKIETEYIFPCVLQEGICIRIEYLIKDHLFPLSDETYEFIFANNVLVETQWHN